MEEVIERYRYPLVFLLGGLILIAGAVLYFNRSKIDGSSKIEIINDESEVSETLVVEVSGGVEKPGVYKMDYGSRVEDAIISAGGMSQDADRIWVEKMLNRAAKLTDGQKIYIPVLGDVDKQTNVSSANNDGVYQNTSSQVLSHNTELVNVNTASAKELDSLPGIGPVYAQKIVEQRPYSNVEELLSKGALKASVYEKIKNLVSVY